MARKRRGPRFESDLRRSAPGRRQARARLLVVCGAQAIESDYLRGLVGHVENPAVTVRIKNKPVSPAQLVAYTADLLAQAREDFDEVWCVFDVDEFQDVERAVADARRAGIEVAVSNPCFELWLLLHFCEHRSYAHACRDVVSCLKRYLPSYNKRLEFRRYEKTWRDAVPRARRLAPAGKEHEVNPATGVWPLVERIAGPTTAAPPPPTAP